MPDTQTQIPESIPYATPTSDRRPTLTPAVWLGIFGLALVFLGGCFLIGVMVINMPDFQFHGPGSSRTLTISSIILMIVLYAATFGCFAGAVALILRTIKRLDEFMHR